jgi:Na+-transporting methylmalonyl-CoA/oxaloacetate decarboxylase gamma subunit
MRALFGILGLLLVVAVVGFVSKKQMSSISDIKVPAAASSEIAIDPNQNVKQQSQQIQNQVKSAVEAAVNQSRPVTEEK